MMSFQFRVVVAALLTLAFLPSCEDVTDRKSRQGETCSYNNHCEGSLSCIEGMCVQDEFPVDYTGKVCVVIECVRDRDCLDGQVCTDGRCEDDLGTCEGSDSCGAGQICSRGRCIECVEDENCDENEVCVSGFCEEGCVSDLECALFQSCKDSRCQNTGCRNDRQCILFTGNRSAVCNDSVCTVPCASNAQCGGLQACIEGTCTFIGCFDSRDCIACLNGTSCAQELGSGADITAGSVECVPREEISSDD